MTDVFISYRREDRERARTIAEMFAAYGFDVWWDVDLLPGQKFTDEINSVIKNAKAVVVLWTPESIQSDWVKAEAVLAMNRGILVPAWLEKTDLPVPYNTLHTHDLSDWGGDAEDERLTPLLDAVRNIAGQPPEEMLHRSEFEIDKILDKPIHEAGFWASVANRNPQSIAEYEAYLDIYGKDGPFAELAQLRIGELEKAANTYASSGHGAKISILGVELPIHRWFGVVLIFIGGIGVIWWNWDDVCTRLDLCDIESPPLEVTPEPLKSLPYPIDWTAVSNVTFSVPPDGWTVGNYSSKEIPVFDLDVLEGKYRWSMEFSDAFKGPHWETWMDLPYGPEIEFYAAVDIKLVQSSGETRMALIFGKSDSSDFAFKISSNNSYWLSRYDANKNKNAELVHVKQAGFDARHNNRIAVAAMDNRLRLYINSKRVGQVPRPANFSGTFALSVSSKKLGKVFVDFDNFELRAPK